MKRLIFLCFFSFFVILFLFYRPLISLFITWSIQGYVQAHWGQPLHYEQVYFEGNQFIFLKPALKNNPCLTAEKLLLSFDFDFWTRNLYVDVTLDHPEGNFQSLFSIPRKNWGKVLSRQGKWFHLHPSLHIKDAFLHWTLTDQSYGHLLLDMQANNREGGIIQVYFNPQEKDKNCLMVQALSFSEGIQIKGRCCQVECTSLFTLLQLLGVETPLSIHSGFVHGQIQAYFPARRRPYVEGELSLKDFTFDLALAVKLQGRIEEARIQLEKNSIENAVQTLSPLSGTLELIKPAFLAYSSSSQKGELSQIIGSIKFKEGERAWVALESKVKQSDTYAHWTLQGLVTLNRQRFLNVDLNASEKKGGAIHLTLYSEPEGRKQGDIQLTQLTYLECNWLKGLFAPYFPVFYDMDLQQGVLNAHLDTEIKKGKIQYIAIKQFEISQFISTFHSKKLCCAFNRIAGYGNFSLKEANIWPSLKGEMYLEGGEVALTAFPALLPIKGIQVHLIIGQGVSGHDSLTLECAGLKGTMKMSRGRFPEDLSLQLEGETHQLIDFFPSSIQKALHQHFDQRPLFLSAHIKTHPHYLKLEGGLHLLKRAGGEDLIHFTCQWGIDKDRLKSLMPVGTFYVQSLPLETYFSPFIFYKEALKLTGEAEVRGAFDAHSITLKYRIADLTIEDKQVCLKKEARFSDQSENLWGEHTFDWQRASHQGTFPIQHFSYLVKEKDLLFENIQGVLSFKDQALSCAPIEAYCKGIYFAGTLDVDYKDPSPGVFDLSIECPTLFGTLSQIQSLSSHLQLSSFLNRLPLEGEFSAKERGLRLHFTFGPQDYALKGEIQGAVVNAVLPFNQADMALKGVYMDVHYEHSQQTLTLTDIQGTWLVGKPKRVEEYLFLSPRLCITHLSDPDLAINFSIFKDQKELIRLAGYTETEPGEKGLKNVYIDLEQSYLSAIRLQKWQCLLKEWSSIEALAIQGHFDSGPLLSDLQCFNTLLGKFDQTLFFNLSFQGKGEFFFHYDPIDCSYHYTMDIPSLEGRDGMKHRGAVKGRWQHHKWIIDQLEWDDLTLYAELEKKLDRWSLPFLGLSLEKTLLIGLEGNYFPQDCRLQAQLKYCEVDEHQPERWKKWKTVLSKCFQYPFELQLNEKHLSFSMLIKQDPLCMKVLAEMDWPFKEATCSLVDEQAANQKQGGLPLVMQWAYQDEQGWNIRSVQGGFYGCSFNLIDAPNQIKNKYEMALKGQVAINFKQLSPLFALETREMIEKLKLSSDYFFQGQVKVHFDRGDSLWEALYYDGQVFSQPIQLKGFELHSFEASIHAAPGRIELGKIAIKDQAGEAQIPHLIAIREQETKQWSLFIPRLIIRNLRPSLLKEQAPRFISEKGKYHALVIKRLEMQDFFGCLNDFSTWQGTGNLHFLNPSPKDLAHPLLAIPAEIILRLGLDSQVLNPMIGTLYFKLKGERFYLTRFKDVYSEGRRSKFHLAQRLTSSWIDWKGNLFVQIRMRHYNLFFKLAEFFTISIQGNFKHPVYMLTKQNKGAFRKGHFLSIDL